MRTSRNSDYAINAHNIGSDAMLGRIGGRSLDLWSISAGELLINDSFLVDNIETSPSLPSKFTAYVFDPASTACAVTPLVKDERVESNGHGWLSMSMERSSGFAMGQPSSRPWEIPPAELLDQLDSDIDTSDDESAIIAAL